MLTRIRHLLRLRESARAAGPVSQEDSNYRNLLINGAWLGLFDGGILNYLPVYLARIGASPSLLGMLTSGPALMGMLSYIPGGAFAERRRDMVGLVVRAGFLTRLSYPLVALLPFLVPPSYIPLVVVVIWSLAALPNSVQIPAFTTVMQKAVSQARRPHLNGERWALLSLVSATALAVFGWMLDHTPFPAGYQVVFMISFFAALMNLYTFAKVRVPPFEKMPSVEAVEPGRLAGARAFLAPLLECRQFVRYNAATLPFRLVLYLPIALYSLYWVQDLQATDTWIGLRGTTGYVALVVGYRFWGRITNRIGHRRLLYITGALFALYPVLTALAPSVQWLLPAALVWGLAASGIDIGFFDMLLASCPEGRQPSFSATANLLASTVAFAGPLLGAALAQALGVQNTLLLCGVLQVCSIAFFVLLPSREQERVSFGAAG